MVLPSPIEEEQSAISPTMPSYEEPAYPSTMHPFKEPEYPPNLPEEQLLILLADIKDWQINHGSQLKRVDTDEVHTVLSIPVGTTLFPTLFPKELFQEALSLQRIYNKLYTSVAEDEDWLYDTLKELIDVDPLIRVLWFIHQEVKKEGFVQDSVLGIFRSDYMLHFETANSQGRRRVGLKQVEFNTVTCAGGVHGNRISSMHRYLSQIGIYHHPNESTSSPPISLDATSMPQNTTLKMIVQGLQSAHEEYGPSFSKPPLKTCILMIVEPRNFNIADERPIEYSLWSHSIPTFRVLFLSEVLTHTRLTPSRALIYSIPNRGLSYEVSVIYFRSAFQPHEYLPSTSGYASRLQLERSRAIKCPSILSHLTTLKKVQQALTLPGTLERFLDVEEAGMIRKTFAPQYPLDGSELGVKGRELASNEETAKCHILKPSREGGGHNIYGKAIISFLKDILEEEWDQYILMEKIQPPLPTNYLISPRGPYKGPVVSELGVFGVCMWRREVEKDVRSRANMIMECEPCWSLKTKDASVDEMSVVKGYGCFDSPLLVDIDVFMSFVGKAEESDE